MFLIVFVSIRVLKISKQTREGIKSYKEINEDIKKKKEIKEFLLEVLLQDY